MKENNLEYNDGMEIDVQRLVNAILKKIWMVILACVLGAAVALAALFVTKNNQKENSSDPVSGYTSMSTWDETDN